MELYMAPMEGLTGYVYRNAHHKYFHSIDKYFTPFLTNKKLSHKEWNDILPEHNSDMRVIPQILTNRAEDFLEIARELENLGYETVNLNLGCPSGTVVAKHRGAGFLAYPEELDRFLAEIFDACTLKISVKTRIGRDSRGEWESLLAIFERYPLEELIIHPRIQKDYYKNTPDLAAFETAAAGSRHALCYNGDINTAEEYKKLTERFMTVNAIMLGRGILMNPFLPDQIRGTVLPDQKLLRAFHDEILNGYMEMMSGDRNVLFRMKELWSYLGKGFPGAEKYMKKIKKSERVAEYLAVVDALFREQEFSAVKAGGATD